MTLSQVLGFASGSILILTGLALLAARPRREGSQFFSLFILIWGTEITLFNSAGFVEDEGLLISLFAVGLGLILIETLFLVHFIGRFSRVDREGSLVWSWAVGALVLVLGLLFLVDAGLFVDGIGFSTLGIVGITVPRFGAFYVTLYILSKRLLQDVSDVEARELGIVFAALSLYASYFAGFQNVQYAADWSTWVELQGLWSTVVLTALFALATAFIGALAYRLWRRASAVEARRATIFRRVSLSIVLPWALGVGVAITEVAGAPWFGFFGVFRIGTALLIAYGLLKFEIFDIDRKIKLGLRGSAIAGLFVLVFFAASETVEFFLSNQFGTWAGLGAAGLLTLGFRPIEERASRLSDRAMPGVDDSPAYEHKRKVEVYQAAVERAMGDEVLTEREKGILAGLRDELGLRDNEAREIEERFLPEPVVS